MVVTPEGKLEASALAEAQEVLHAKALPNGDEVTKVWLVLPLRAHALAMHEQDVAQGFEAALYPGTGGRFWDPSPAGPWLSESTDAGAKAR